jgi:hypothetical protein
VRCRRGPAAVSDSVVVTLKNVVTESLLGKANDASAAQAACRKPEYLLKTFTELRILAITVNMRAILRADQRKYGRGFFAVTFCC